LPRKNFKIKITITLGLLFYLTLKFSFILADSSTSSAVDLTNQETTLQNQLGGINNKIKTYQSQISEAQSRADTLKNEIEIMDDEVASTQLALQAKQTEVENTNLQITEVKLLILQKQQDIETNQQVLGELIVQLNDYDNEYAIQTTLGSSSLSDFLDQIQYAGSYSDKINQLVDKIKTLKAQLVTQQNNLQAQLANLQTLQNELQITQGSLTEQAGQKQTLLDQTRGIESNYQKLLASSQASAADLEKEVNDLDNKIRAQLGNKTLPPSQGILAWPVDGVVTQGYGNTGFTALGYTFHNGLDVAGPAGAPVYAAADGVIFDTDESYAEFGNWVAIKHSLTGTNGPINIVTLYGHLRSFIVKPGQSVKQGDLIGYEGNTGNTTAKLYGPERGYHVHFGVYDADGFGVTQGAYTKIYGPYKVPYGYTYNPLDFLGK
jgi:murein DD-endopeptidase MepM/ murein hydrolase activator NlpD